MKRVLNTQQSRRLVDTGRNSHTVGRQLVLLLVAALVLANAAFTGRASAEGIAAVPFGPEGGNISVLAQAPSQSNTLYAGTFNGGVFRSNDNGGTWVLASNGLLGVNIGSFATINTLVVDPRNPSTVYAGTGSGLYKSFDGGEHWSGLPLGAFVTAIAIDPSDPNVVYGATYSVECVCGPFGGGSIRITGFANKSTDGGATWKQVFTGGEISDIALDPSDPHTVYALGNAELLKSTDAGTTWQTSSTTIPGYSNAILYDRLTLAPTTPTTLYVGRGQGIAKSTDGGASWTMSNTGLPIDVSSHVTAVHDISLAPGLSTTLYAATDAGVYTSNDSGATWHISGGELASVSVHSVLATETGLFAGTTQGAYTSSDNGTTWVRSIHGLTNTNITTVLFDATTPTTVYAGTTHGMYVSNDSGMHWDIASSDIVTETVQTVVQSPTPPNTLYALTRSSDPSRINDSLYSSNDSGVHWSLVSHLPATFETLVINPAQPAILYAGAYNRVYKSVDGGVSWNVVTDQLREVDTLALDPTTPDTIYAGGGDVYKSIDGGANWITTTKDLVFDDWFLGLTFNISTLLVDSHQPNTIYAGTDLGMYMSNDGGNSWHTDDDGLITHAHITTLAQDLSSPSTLYASVAGGDVFKSTNGGASWNADGSGVNGSSVHTMAVNPLDSTHLFVGTTGNGVLSVHQINRSFSVALPVITRT